MTITLGATWGPYVSADDARERLCGFVQRSCGSSVGVVWAANGNLYPLRAPRRDAGGFGDVVVFEWSRRPPPPRRLPTDFWSRARRFIDRCMEQQGQAALMEAQANMAMGQAINRTLGRMFTTHQDDGLGVALDIVCIALSLALLPTGLGVVGLVGLAGGAFLLGSDSYAYALELGGQDESAEAFKKMTEKYRILATVMTLPDIAFGGVKAIRELNEVRELRALDQTTARAAETIGSRTSSAGRSQRYQQVAERAHLRSQIRTRQIHASLAHEVAPRGAGIGSAGLLIREEVLNEESAFHELTRRLQVHTTSVHR